MKFDKQVTLTLGNNESFKIGVSDADSFEQCDEQLSKELTRLDLGFRMAKA